MENIYRSLSYNQKRNAHYWTTRIEKMAFLCFFEGFCGINPHFIYRLVVRNYDFDVFMKKIIFLWKSGLGRHGGAKESGASRPDQKVGPMGGPIGQPLSRRPVFKKFGSIENSNYSCSWADTVLTDMSMSAWTLLVQPIQCNVHVIPMTCPNLLLLYYSLCAYILCSYNSYDLTCWCSSFPLRIYTGYMPDCFNYTI